MNFRRTWYYYLISEESYADVACFKQIGVKCGSCFRTVVVAMLDNPCLAVKLSSSGKWLLSKLLSMWFCFSIVKKFFLKESLEIYLTPELFNHCFYKVDKICNL